MKLPNSVLLGLPMILIALALLAFQLTMTGAVPILRTEVGTDLTLPEVSLPAFGQQPAPTSTATPAVRGEVLLPTPTPADLPGAPLLALPDTGITLPQPRANANANVRSGPGTHYPIVGGILAGSELAITGGTSAGDWYQLAGGGWVAASLVDCPPGAGSAGGKPGLVGMLASAAAASATDTAAWPRVSLAAGAVAVAYPPGWTVTEHSSAEVELTHAATNAQRMQVTSPPSSRHAGDPFGVMSIVQRQFAADPGFANSPGIVFQVLVTGTLDLPGAPVYTSGLAYVAPELPPVSIVMVDVATAEAPTTLVYMDFAAADATADGLAALLPMVESLGYPNATE